MFSKREVISLELQGAQLQEMKWDYTGALLCTGTKNREYHIWDPRTVNIVSSFTVRLDASLTHRATPVRVAVT